MSQLFGNSFGLPGIQASLDATEREIFWGKFDQQVIVPLLVLSSAVDAGNTPTTILRPGLLMGKVTSSGKWKEWNPTGTDGSELIQGVMLYDQNMLNSAATAADRFSYIVTAGRVKTASLIAPGTATYGIDGNALEIIIRTQLTLTGRFMLDDEYWGATQGGVIAHKSHTTNYSVLERDNNYILNTLGNAGAINFTLPAPRIGLRYGFFNAVGQNMVITSSPANGLIAFNNASGTTLTFSTAGNLIGAFVEVIGVSATKWLVLQHGSHTMVVA